MDNDHLYDIALTLVPGIGSRIARQLLDIIPCSESLFALSASELRELFGNREETIRSILDKDAIIRAQKEMEFISKNKIKVHFYTEPDYPQRLNLPGCEDSPILLYSLGDANLNPERVVSVVGTRKATQGGIDLTHRLITGFNNENITVVSGLAFGIDTAAHKASLNNGLPTIAVLGHGLDIIYPSQNRQLAKQIIASGGSLVTEMHSGTPLSPSLFPARNRIIAGFSDATVVVEASKSGGALITANIACGYHRELFAFPGRVDDKYSEGCNAIIANNKAMLIRNADDLFNNMGWERNITYVGKQTTMFPKLVGDEKKVYDILAEHPEISSDDILGYCDLPLSKIATALLGLELKNLCRCLPGKIYKII